MRRSATNAKGLAPWLDDSGQRRRFGQRLLAWFGRHARDLPWRRTRDPYAIWVSEIMLQQTQVATVVPYFERFLRRFPTIQALAEADEHDVLRLWEGLGYYRRARQLHRAAKQVMAEHEGQFPADRGAVGRLPGIGRYTAGAILSIAFGAREAILEANTLRLWSRLLAYRGDPRSSRGQRFLWEAAERALPRRNAAAFNQALMELGATVCQPRAPACDTCPVADFCEARRLGVEHTVPRRPTKPKVELVREAAVVVHRGAKVLIVKRAEDARWAGMWDFPRFAVPAEVAGSNGEVERFLRLRLRSTAGVSARRLRRLATLRHTVTRFRITLECFEGQHVSSRAAKSRTELRWVDPQVLGDYPLNATGRELAQLIAK